MPPTHLGLVYRNFAAYHSGYCHVGLGVNALHTVRTLRRAGVDVDAYSVDKTEDVAALLDRTPSLTHLVLEAPWMKSSDLALLANRHPRTELLVRAHSEVGFLQVEPRAIRLLREQLELQEQLPNVHVAANSRHLARFFHHAYQARCLYLPNLYDLERTDRRRDERHHHRTLRIGSFGALRQLKNHSTAAAAALLVGRELGADVEFWISVHREEHGSGVLAAIRALFDRVPGARLVEHPWEPWPAFRRTIGHMDLCMQVSFTETFNVVSADAAAEGIASVVGRAIEWTPASWRADADDVQDVAQRASHLLSSHAEAAEGLEHLARYVREGVHQWRRYLAESVAPA
jgi:glycosyltransferase involved in cell wall biosynthesis